MLIPIEVGAEIMAAKIMLVEDDTNLSEIYKARLEAEGFQIISAKDGEEALAMAVREHPDLIICDVMMPKISGFDMLDILRGTNGIKDTRVIMMTALGQSEDKARAEKLGADRYLVKSQVTLEDVVKTVHDVLESNDNATNVSSDKVQSPTQTTNTVTPSDSTPQPSLSSINDISSQTLDITTNSTQSTQPSVQPDVQGSVNDSAIPSTDSSTSITNNDQLPVKEETNSVNDTSSAASSTDVANDPKEEKIEADSQSINTEESAVQSQIQNFLNKQGADQNTNDLTSNSDTQDTITTASQGLSDKPLVNLPDITPPPNIDKPTPTDLSTSTLDITRGDDNAVKVAHKKVIQPSSNMTNKPDLATLLAHEEGGLPSTMSTDGFFSPTSTHPDNHAQ